jgi:transposase-like protein
MTKRSKKAWMKWRRLVSEQARSGQSVKAFCGGHGLCRPYFFVWKKRLEEDTPTEFLEVQVAGMGRARPAIRALKSDCRMGEA